MEEKVILYDANGVRIGITYMRRARQLVRQQRAVWVDDSQSAVRFAPGMENMDTDADDPLTVEPVAALPSVSAENSLKLNNLVEKQMHERKKYITHSFAFIFGIIFMTMVIHYVSYAPVVISHWHSEFENLIAYSDGFTESVGFEPITPIEPVEPIAPIIPFEPIVPIEPFTQTQPIVYASNYSWVRNVLLKFAIFLVIAAIAAYVIRTYFYLTDRRARKHILSKLSVEDTAMQFNQNC